MPAGAALELRGVRRTFKQGGAELRVLNGVDLVLRPGEVVALVGPSGAGKSTLLHVAGLLERPDGGEVLVAGKECGSMSDGERTYLAKCTSCHRVYEPHEQTPSQWVQTLDKMEALKKVTLTSEERAQILQYLTGDSSGHATGPLR